jgi:hypothetical protein
MKRKIILLGLAGLGAYYLFKKAQETAMAEADKVNQMLPAHLRQQSSSLFGLGYAPHQRKRRAAGQANINFPVRVQR